MLYVGCCLWGLNRLWVQSPLWPVFLPLDRPWADFSLTVLSPQCIEGRLCHDFTLVLSWVILTIILTICFVTLPAWFCGSFLFKTIIHTLSTSLTKILWYGCIAKETCTCDEHAANGRDELPLPLQSHKVTRRQGFVSPISTKPSTLRVEGICTVLPS